VNGSTEWFDIGMYPDACSAHHLTQNTMEGDCLHASSAIVQASLKSSPSTCLDRSQIQPGGPSRRLYVLGDSHATVLMFGVKAAFQRSFTVVQTTCGAGCGFNPSSFFTEPPAPMRSWAAFTNCNRTVMEVQAMLNATVQPGDVVMVVTASFRYFWGVPREGGLARQVAFLTQLNHEILAPRGASLVVTDDVPYLGSSGTACMLHLNNTPGAIADSSPCRTDPTQILNWEYHENYQLRGSSQSRHEMIVANFTAFAAQYANVHFMEALYAPFCTGGFCRAVIPGTTTVAFHDRDHLATAGALYLAPFMSCFFYAVGLINMFG
jgi:hypothetical protein